MSPEPICVFCASSPGTSPVYEAAARSVGEAIAKSGRKLVYGGGVRGMMGFVSDAALQAGGLVHGIIPQALTGRAAERAVRKLRSPTEAEATPESGGGKEAEVEGSKEGTGEEVGTDARVSDRFTSEVVNTMHERKQRMADLSQGGFIVLPGGFGTFEEVMEMTTWSQLRIHRLPVVVLNVNGFYTPLKQQIELAVQEGFIAPANMSLIEFVDLEARDDPMLDWGKRGMEAVERWSVDDSAGYQLSWSSEEGKPLGRKA
ncbi:hypothetical protein FFLO_02614 [Filobasidium floriforme]|uniref:Cytokinin riboside 5'-monophosphate phosphoribohydrolase n=1 Tax=Filobasidium floriforme TaxID=5210 RepID=A0A8K0JMC8_9TREE|nr:uncharacterized protein HD553DRAFT_308270 [Filobasidium floriforme]KAG7561974.1 hypothetical protein FFLO_02614 [Filobasidium floriforme]KAH8087474.1 hypothetical protein HD553DRAFT_308270 [Filobasidium floriforme]